VRYSLHQIHESDNYPFDAADYSYFKFGNTEKAQAFGKALFDGFIAECGAMILQQNEIVVLPSPYHHIPTASNYLCFYFTKHLNRFLYHNGKKAAATSKIYRNQTYTEDYGNLDFEQRVKLIANDTYYIDRNYIEGKCCIFIDDIKITGSHELTVNKILDQYAVKGNFCFLYFAELMNKAIHPNIENHFNYFAVKSMEDIGGLARQAAFKFNTRAVKYVLSATHEEFLIFLATIPEELSAELLDLALGNNYHLIDKYNYNIQHLKNTLWPSTYKKDKEKPLAHRNLPLV